MTNLPVRCQCGAIQGTLHNVSPSTTQHLTCHCDDCRTFIRHIGRADDLLTAHGGITVVQTSPPCLTIEQGIEHVGCIRLSPKGLLRWYATCCNTPLANMLDKPGLPFIGVQRCTLPDDAESILGPSTGIQGRFATGDRSTLQAHNTAPMVVFVRTAYRLGVNVLRGQARPSPFHKPDGSFITTPTVLSKDQRNAARDPT
jgi:hypothetical protein